MGGGAETHQPEQPHVRRRRRRRRPTWFRRPPQSAKRSHASFSICSFGFYSTCQLRGSTCRTVLKHRPPRAVAPSAGIKHLSAFSSPPDQNRPGVRLPPVPVSRSVIHLIGAPCTRRHLVHGAAPVVADGGGASATPTHVSQLATALIGHKWRKSAANRQLLFSAFV